MPISTLARSAAIIVLTSVGVFELSRPALAGAPRSASAARNTGSIKIDGVLDEPSWSAASSTGDFWQREPHEGQPPTHQTEFRVLYDDQAIYVGVVCHDGEPGQIRRTLTRRDDSALSDRVEVAIDSYNDKRTAFVFTLTPASVQRDFLMFNDVEVDDSWDAVWTAKATINDGGWAAEFRIPLSQLRFSSDPTQTWGLQVVRTVARLNERTMWAPWPVSSSGQVSLYGAVEGLQVLRPPRRVEILPYAVAGAKLRRVSDAADPFADSAEVIGNLGADFKYGLSNNFTLAGTINPDFGQVEADPSEVNLSALESFFVEKRPFFLEGTDIFRFGFSEAEGVAEQLFYSRRIGRTPQGLEEAPAGYLSAPSSTTIYGAAKLSGKTKSGLSFGVLDALTGEETATIDDGAGNRTTRIVEPTTNYGMLRLKQDFNRGASSVGAGLTAVNRTASGAEAVALHDQAYAGGLQLTHRFARDMYGLDARLFGSYVHGSADAIDRTQRAPQRYYQRPDAKHVDYDPTRTSLSGMGLVWSIGKIGGEHWRFIAGNDLRTPGLEMNDLGFQQFSDSAAHQAVGQYRDDKPGDYLQSFNLSARGSVTTDFAPDLSYASASIDGSMTLRNFWSLSAGASMDRVFLSTIALRGGPALAGFDAYSASLGGLSDSRKPVRGSVNVNARTVPETGTRSLDADLQLVVQARANLEISVGPLVSRRINGDQYVTEAMNTQTSGMEYILARLDQTTVALTARLNYTFSPSLSLQLYAQPFLSTGVYGRYKAVIAPRARRHEDRFHVFSDADATLQGAVYEVDRDGDGTSEYSFAPADFNFRQMRSNLVFRWEYRPGSTLFLVWSHQRSSEDATGRFDLGSELGALAREPGEHVILAKLSYWYAL